MNSEDFVKFALQITIMLAMALFFGQLMRRFKQPAVLGEMIGGIILGPTIIGLLLPNFYYWLFQSSANIVVVRDASIKLGMLFFLFISGLDVNISDMKSMGGKAIVIGSIGTLLPIIGGVGIAYLLKGGFWGEAVNAHFFSFALFLGMNLANSANPVIARILMDLGLLKLEIGSTIMTATIVDDLVNWTLFAIILSDIAPSSGAGQPGIFASIVIVLGFFILVLGLGRWLGPKALPWIRKRLSWPSGFIAFTALVILIGSSVSEWIGINAFFGAFLVGIAVGQNSKEAKEAHDVITQFVLSFFAPIYFVSMGMTTNFLQNFDILMVLVLILVATVLKVGAVMIGARIAGMKMDRHALAIGFGLNARGATGIILANVGLVNGLIDERIFVGVVVMAIVTSLMSGPVMNKLLGGKLQLNDIDPHEEILTLDRNVNPGQITTD